MRAVSDVITRQRAQRETLRVFPPAPRKRPKAIKQEDVDAAVAAAFDAMDRELRRLGIEFPKNRVAFDVARASLARVKGGAA